MIQDAYVSFEIAKLLKDKGFDGDCENECHMFYHEMTDRIMPIMEIGMIPDYDDIYFAPTHQMAMAWLREVHNILLWVYPIIPSPVPSDKTAFKWSWDGKQKWHSAHHFGGMYRESYDTPEEAVEAALKYSLENLV